MSNRAGLPAISAERAARIAPGDGIVVHRTPLTVAVTATGDVESLAVGVTNVVRRLVDDGDLAFGPVAAELQQFVIDHQPAGVAAVLDIAPDPIAFLFDQASAIGDGATHRASGRAGWTTVFVEGDSVSLVVGAGPERAVIGWSQLWAGVTPGVGAQVELTRSYDPEAPTEAAPVDPTPAATPVASASASASASMAAAADEPGVAASPGRQTWFADGPTAADPVGSTPLEVDRVAAVEAADGLATGAEPWTGAGDNGAAVAEMRSGQPTTDVAEASGAQPADRSDVEATAADTATWLAPGNDADQTRPESGEDQPSDLADPADRAGAGIGELAAEASTELDTSPGSGGPTAPDARAETSPDSGDITTGTTPDLSDPATAADTDGPTDWSDGHQAEATAEPAAAESPAVATNDDVDDRAGSASTPATGAHDLLTPPADGGDRPSGEPAAGLPDLAELASSNGQADIEADVLQPVAGTDIDLDTAIDDVAAATTESGSPPAEATDPFDTMEPARPFTADPVVRPSESTIDAIEAAGPADPFAAATSLDDLIGPATDSPADLTGEPAPILAADMTGVRRSTSTEPEGALDDRDRSSAPPSILDDAPPTPTLETTPDPAPSSDLLETIDPDTIATADHPVAGSAGSLAADFPTMSPASPLSEPDRDEQPPAERPPLLAPDLSPIFSPRPDRPPSAVDLPAEVTRPGPLEGAEPTTDSTAAFPQAPGPRPVTPPAPAGGRRSLRNGLAAFINRGRPRIEPNETGVPPTPSPLPPTPSDGLWSLGARTPAPSDDRWSTEPPSLAPTDDGRRSAGPSPAAPSDEPWSPAPAEVASPDDELLASFPPPGANTGPVAGAAAPVPDADPSAGLSPPPDQPPGDSDRLGRFPPPPGVPIDGPPPLPERPPIPGEEFRHLPPPPGSPIDGLPPMPDGPNRSTEPTDDD